LIGKRHGDASAALLQSFVGDGVRPVLRRRIKSNRIGVLLHSPARKTSARREPWHYSTSTEDSPVAVDAPWWSEAKGLAGVRSQRMHARFVSQRGAFGTSPKTVFASRRCRGCASLVRLARPRPGAVGPWTPRICCGWSAVPFLRGVSPHPARRLSVASTRTARRARHHKSSFLVRRSPS
jgi:hypothetical protein